MIFCYNSSISKQQQQVLQQIFIQYIISLYFVYKLTTQSLIIIYQQPFKTNSQPQFMSYQNINESVILNAHMKLIINYKMFQSFKQFYQVVNQNSLNWTQLENSLRIKRHRYPTNSQIESYYYNNFNKKTANIGRSKWHIMDKLLLVWVVFQYCSLNQKSHLFLDKSDFQVLHCILGVQSEILQLKWLKIIKPYIKNKPWCQAEDSLIFELMKSDFYKKWTDIAIKISQSQFGNGLRTAKQVRQRWYNYIDPSIKRDQWTPLQDQKLLKMVQQNGRKWSTFGVHFKRTQNNIKNRYFSISKIIESSSDKFDYLRKTSSQNSVKPEQQNKNQFSSLISQIQIQKTSIQHPIERKVCGYRNLLEFV